MLVTVCVRRVCEHHVDRDRQREIDRGRQTEIDRDRQKSGHNGHYRTDVVRDVF